MQEALWRGANYGQAQLGPSKPQKSKLIDQVLVPLLCLFLSSIGGDGRVN
jgi:hypothetical protein